MGYHSQQPEARAGPHSDQIHSMVLPASAMQDLKASCRQNELCRGCLRNLKSVESFEFSSHTDASSLAETGFKHHHRCLSCISNADGKRPLQKRVANEEQSTLY